MYSPTEEELKEALHYLFIISNHKTSRFAVKPPIEDLLSVGHLEIVKILNDFDPSRGVPFNAFAAIRLRWEIGDYLRCHFFGKSKSDKRDRIRVSDTVQLYQDIDVKEDVLSVEPDFERPTELQKRLAKLKDWQRSIVEEVLEGRPLQEISKKHHRTIPTINRILKTVTGDEHFCIR